MRFAALIAVVLLTCGFGSCGRRPDPPPVPETVYVTVERIVPVPRELTADCDRVLKRENTVAEAVRLANSRLASLDECSGRMRRIRELAP